MATVNDRKINFKEQSLEEDEDKLIEYDRVSLASYSS